VLSTDDALASVAKAIRGLDPDGSATGRVLRSTFDQLYDGGRTGRYRWDQLFKTEKTHFGTLVEINLQREFHFADGQTLDFRIANVEVDAKYSQMMGGWMLPPEAVGQLCLVITASDQKSEWSMGVVRAAPEHLNLGANRDAKKTLNAVGRAAILCLHRAAPLPPNVLLHLPTSDVEAIFAQRSGQQRVNELFRRAAGHRVSRAAVETVAQQRDPMKRVRGNGGARQHLAAEGIAIFGGDYGWQRDAARDLGLPVPGDSEFVSVRLTRAPSEWHRPAASIAGERWVRAEEGSGAEIPEAIYSAARRRPASKLS
jgi:hypothetical protein